MSHEWSPAGYAAPQNSGKATGSLIAGILSFFACPIVLSIVAIVLGSQALREIRESGGQVTGEGMAQAGLILGWISIALALVIAVIAIAVAITTS